MCPLSAIYNKPPSLSLIIVVSECQALALLQIPVLSYEALRRASEQAAVFRSIPHVQTINNPFQRLKLVCYEATSGRQPGLHQ